MKSLPRLLSRLLSLLLSIACCAAGAEPATPNDVARWLAGMPAADADAAPSPQRTRLDQAWAELEAGRTTPMRAFAARHLAREQAQCSTLFYPFSGPDVLNAVALFPDCGTYVMFGLEAIGELPRLERMSDAGRAAVLADMARAQDTMIKRNFFVTRAMRGELNTPHLKGTLPLMTSMLVRMGYEVRAIRLLQVDGTPMPLDSLRRPRAVGIDFGRPGRPDQHLFYANFDASNEGLKNRPDFLNYMDGVHGVVTLLKAASYLLHDDSFSVMRNLIRDRSVAIVQDDSGLPYARLTESGFEVELYGNYVGTIPVFSYRYQRDLANAYVQASEREPLPFAWSYAKKRDEEALQIARRPGA
jgi:hypothetical protein